MCGMLRMFTTLGPQPGMLHIVDSCVPVCEECDPRMQPGMTLMGYPHPEIDTGGERRLIPPRCF